jgi:chemotaxis signal transduction protein
VTQISERAVALRHEFDRAFAEAPRAKRAVWHDLIAIRAGVKPYLLRLAEIVALFADKKVTRVPGGAAALLGLAGLRGALVPVYGLRTLLGDPSPSIPRWIVIAAKAPVGFAFDAFEGQLRVAAEAIVPQPGDAKTGFTPDFIRAEGALRPIVQLSSLLDAIET